MPEVHSPLKQTHLQWLIEALKIETDSCQAWPFKKLPKGYGLIFIQGKSVYVHRLVLKMRFPDFDESLLALHRCDNPNCFNPRHLFQGSHSDNMQDMLQKNRQHRGRKWVTHQGPNANLQGEKNANSKLNDEAIRQIRAVSGQTQAEIGESFGVSQVLIGLIRNRKIWIHVK